AEQPLPLMQLRLPLWVRELRRIVGTLREPELVAESGYDQSEGLEGSASRLPPLLAFGDDQPARDKQQIRLPLVQCRECHGTAWLTRMEVAQPVNQQIELDLANIYSAFFSNHQETGLLMPWLPSGDKQVSGPRLTHFRVCRACGFTAGLEHSGGCKACQAGNEALVRVSRPDLLKEERVGHVNRVVHQHNCPYCSAKASLVVFGARA